MAAGTAGRTSCGGSRRRAVSGVVVRDRRHQARARDARRYDPAARPLLRAAGAAQGARPEHFHVVTPDPDDPIHDLSRRRLRRVLPAGPRAAGGDVAQDDEDVAAAQLSRSRSITATCVRGPAVCSQKRRADDHLSLVAGISRVQRARAEQRVATRRRARGDCPLPLAFKPDAGSTETYVRVREQARVQFESRGNERARSTSCWPSRRSKGLAGCPSRRPATSSWISRAIRSPAKADASTCSALVTLDAGGEPVYRACWALTDAGRTRRPSRRSWTSIVDVVDGAPGMHVYHYAPYEPSALQAADGPLRDARGGDRRAASRAALRRPLRGRAPGPARGRRALLDQEPRAVLRVRRATSPLLDASRSLRAHGAGAGARAAGR